MKIQGSMKSGNKPVITFFQEVLQLFIILIFTEKKLVTDILPPLSLWSACTTKFHWVIICLEGDKGQDTLSI